MSQDPDRRAPIGRALPSSMSGTQGRVAVGGQPQGGDPPVVSAPRLAPVDHEAERAPRSFAGETPALAVDVAVRQARGAGAAVASLLVLAGLVGGWLLALRWPAPEVTDPAPAAAPLPEDVEIEIRYTIENPPAVAPRQPADAVLVLYPDHEFDGWRLDCDSSWDVAVSQGDISKGAQRVVIPNVPPTACRLHFFGPGAPPAVVTAGATVRCALSAGTAGTTVCRTVR